MGGEDGEEVQDCGAQGEDWVTPGEEGDGTNCPRDSGWGGDWGIWSMCDGEFVERVDFLSFSFLLSYLLQ